MFCSNFEKKMCKICFVEKNNVFVRIELLFVLL